MRSMNFRREQIALAWLLLLVIGCGPVEESKPTALPTAGTNPPSATSVPPQVATADGGVPKSTSPLTLSSDQKSTSSVPQPQPAPENPSPSAPDKPANLPIQEPEKPTTPPVVKPTAEQLARWKVDPFEPFQLLAVRDHSASGLITFIAPTEDNSHVILGGTRLALWSIDGEQSVHDFVEATTDDEERLLCFAMAPQGNWCVTGDASGRLRKFDIGERKELLSKLTNTNAVVKLAISPDGKEIATIPFTSDVIIWDADTLEKKTSFSLDTRDVKHLQFLAPQVLLAAGETLSTWDSSSGTKLKTFPSGRYQTAIALSKDGKELIFGAEDYLHRWDIESHSPTGEYRGVPYRDPDVEFTTDGTLLAVASGDAVRILDVATGRLLQIIDAAGSTISDVSWMNDKPVLIVANDAGKTRIWGRSGDAVAMGNHESPNNSGSANSTPQVPATVFENLAILDLRVLPKLPDSKPQSDEFHAISYATPVDAEEVKAFYRHILSERGWSEVVEQSSQYGLMFQKSGFYLSLSSYGDKPTETYVSSALLGNYDLRQVPRLDTFIKEKTFAGPTTVIDKVSANLLQIETELLKKFHEAGWTAIVRLNRSQNETNDGRDFEFVKNGAVIRIMVLRDQVNPQLFNINYTQSLTLHSLPVPPDVGLMEWDDFSEARLVADTTMNMEEATRFFDEEMPKHGWTPRPSGRRVDKEVAYLPFYWGQRDVTIGLEPAAGGKVRIRAGRYSDKSMSQLSDESNSNSDQQAAGAQSEPAVGLEAADLPILHALGEPTYRSNEGEVSVELEKTPLIDLSQKYSDAMKSLGWEVKPFGDPREDFVSLHFEKDGKIIYYQSSVNPLGQCRIEFSGNGLLWNKPIPNKKLISFVSWLRNNRYPASLQRLDEYRAEMEKLNGVEPSK